MTRISLRVRYINLCVYVCFCVLVLCSYRLEHAARGYRFLPQRPASRLAERPDFMPLTVTAADPVNISGDSGTVCFMEVIMSTDGISARKPTQEKMPSSAANSMSVLGVFGIRLLEPRADYTPIFSPRLHCATCRSSQQIMLPLSPI